MRTSIEGELVPGPKARIKVPWFRGLVLLVVALIAFLVLYPIARLLYQTFFSAEGFSLTQIASVFTDPELWPSILNTIVLILVAGPSALVVGAILAWLNERTDARMDWAADILPILPLLAPGIAVAIGWVFLFAPRAGFINVFLRSSLHLGGPALTGSGPIDIYSLWGIIFVTTLLSVPYPYLIISAALRNVDPALEEASRMSGRGPLPTFLFVTVASVRNAIATASTVLVLIIMAMFAAPVVIGIQGGINVLSVHIWEVMYQVSPPRIAEGVILGVLMLVVAQVTVLGEHLVTRNAHYATIGGKGQAHSTTRLGAWRWLARAIILLYIATLTILPIAALVLVSLQGFWTSVINWSNLTLSDYAQLLSPTSDFEQGLVNSVVLAVVTATVLMIISAMIVFFVHSAPGPVGSVANAIATLPSSIPQTVVAIGLLVGFGVGKFSLQGSLLLLFVAYVVLFLPMASRAAGAAISQVGADLSESSSMSGASPTRTFFRILLPLMTGGLLSGWIIVFAFTLGETNASAFLSGSSNPVVGPLILTAWQINGNDSVLAALTVCITIVQLAVVIVLRVFSRDRMLSYRGV